MSRIGQRQPLLSTRASPPSVPNRSFTVFPGPRTATPPTTQRSSTIPVIRVPSAGPSPSHVLLQDTEDEDEETDLDNDGLNDNLDGDDEEEVDIITLNGHKKNNNDSSSTLKLVLNLDPSYATPREVELLAEVRATSTWVKPGMRMFMNWLTNPIYWQMYNRVSPKVGHRQSDIQSLLVEMINNAVKAEQASAKGIESSSKKNPVWTVTKVRTNILYVRSLFHRAVKMNPTGKRGALLIRQEEFCPYFVRLQPIFGTSLPANPAAPPQHFTRSVRPIPPSIELEVEESDDFEVQGEPVATTIPADHRRTMIQEFAGRQREDTKKYSNLWKQRADDITRQERDLFDKLSREAQESRMRLSKELADDRAANNKTLALERAEHSRFLSSERLSVAAERDRDRTRWDEERSRWDAERMTFMEKISDLRTELAVTKKELEMVYHMNGIS
ncbi:hypothetical protein BGW38_009009 [Lunasporangiospora selenospora]|uniref:Uncharacterized protein n=1 Tax=Lunasporangiospora selenospora TaxID=979761 RepID=A0A9P6FXG4_9FUNG|nr:hypothetical protein BGW38_009009 [Lunasporangiospora selenospora]